MEKEIQNKVYRIEDKKVAVYPSTGANMPILYLNMFSEEGHNIYKALYNRGLNCTLVVISGLNWHHDMAPWDIPSIAKGFTPCTKGADLYLQLLMDKIMPEVEKDIPSILWRGIVGYSLAGLFAIYSIYQTEVFSRVASISGSLWFPGFKEYVVSNKRIGELDALYISLGDKECKTKNVYLKTVQENTENITEFFQKKGIDTIFQENLGGHNKEVVERIVAGMEWLLGR